MLHSAYGNGTFIETTLYLISKFFGDFDAFNDKVFEVSSPYGSDAFNGKAKRSEASDIVIIMFLHLLLKIIYIIFYNL